MGASLMPIAIRRPKWLNLENWEFRISVFLLGIVWIICGASRTEGQVLTPETKGSALRRSFFVEYSNDSSHMLLGAAGERKLLTLGASYSIRLFPSRVVSLSYYGEVRPLILESDPTLKEACVTAEGNFPSIVNSCYRWNPPTPVLQTGPKESRFQYFDPVTKKLIYQFDFTSKYGRRWNYAMGLSPVGYDLMLFPRHRLRPVLTGLGGLMVTTHDVPLDKTSNFNFTFEFGAGLERTIAPGRSLRVEYRYHHFSNDYIGAQNPGVDSGVFHVGYIFGH